MAEYIKRDAALKALLQVSAPTPSESYIVEKCVEKINRLPMMEVVRCKDCRWFDKSGYEEDNEHEEDLSLHMGWCLHWRRETQACAFCSYGERKDNERKAD